MLIHKKDCLSLLDARNDNSQLRNCRHFKALVDKCFRKCYLLSWKQSSSWNTLLWTIYYIKVSSLSCIKSMADKCKYVFTLFFGSVNLMDKRPMRMGWRWSEERNRSKLDLWARDKRRSQLSQGASANHVNELSFRFGVFKLGSLFSCLSSCNLTSTRRLGSTT